MNDLWTLTEAPFDPKALHHKETIFTIGNGYLSTRGAFEEGYPGDHRATFVHGVFDKAPLVFTELANAPDWLPLVVLLNGQRFAMQRGAVLSYQRSLDLRNGLLTRRVRWKSPSGDVATLTFQRFASLAEEHSLLIRCQVETEFDGTVEFRLGLNGNTDNEGLAHWLWVDQGQQDEVIYLLNRTRSSQIELATAMRVEADGHPIADSFWDSHNTPTRSIKFACQAGQILTVDKLAAVATSRDTESVIAQAVQQARQVPSWSAALQTNQDAWQAEWQRHDVVIEGDAEAQIAMRFNIFQLLIAAPRHDERVNIGAKTLSGFGYRGHAFWDTEIFILPMFIYAAPHIAENLLNYRYRNLPGARLKARKNGYEGAQFPWESADTGEEVTPTWVPHYADPTQLVRIWTGDIEIHISADIALAAYRFWKATGNDAWMIEKGAELILDTAKFWASRAEWNAEKQRFEYTDVIGPDEYHEHVDNNVYTNRMAQWNLQTALAIFDWLQTHAPAKAAELAERLDLTEARLAHWQAVIDKIYLPVLPNGLIEQFEGYFQRQDVDLAVLEPRDRSVQAIFGIEGTNHTQVLKQPDVLMLLFLLREQYSDEAIKVNYDYYTPRTDHTFGSSLGPSIQAIMACEMNRPAEAYEHFIRAGRADLRDIRGNAGDGIHGASAGGMWQAAVFGFGGLRLADEGWTIQPRLPAHWKRLAFKFYWKGKEQVVDIPA